jgi:hypothetical protein
MASQATPPNNGDGGMALPEGGAMLPNLAASLTSSTASKWYVTRSVYSKAPLQTASLPLRA